jgi:hypothetical protein
MYIYEIVVERVHALFGRSAVMCFYDNIMVLTITFAWPVWIKLHMIYLLRGADKTVNEKLAHIYVLAFKACFVTIHHRGDINQYNY